MIQYQVQESDRKDLKAEAAAEALELARRYSIPIIGADAWEMLRDAGTAESAEEPDRLRKSPGFRGDRPRP